MTEALIRRIADTIVDELFAQSETHNPNSPTAPKVWQYRETHSILVDGFIDVLAVARAVHRAL